MGTDTTVSGEMPGGFPYIVLWGFGYYSLNYSISIDAPDGHYECFIAPSPSRYRRANFRLNS